MNQDEYISTGSSLTRLKMLWNGQVSCWVLKKRKFNTPLFQTENQNLSTFSDCFIVLWFFCGLTQIMCKSSYRINLPKNQMPSAHGLLRMSLLPMFYWASALVLPNWVRVAQDVESKPGVWGPKVSRGDLWIFRTGFACLRVGNPIRLIIQMMSYKPCMVYLYTDTWLIFMVNVGKYTLHGCAG